MDIPVCIHGFSCQTSLLSKQLNKPGFLWIWEKCLSLNRTVFANRVNISDKNSVVDYIPSSPPLMTGHLATVRSYVGAPPILLMVSKFQHCLRPWSHDYIQQQNHICSHLQNPVVTWLQFTMFWPETGIYFRLPTKNGSQWKMCSLTTAALP